MRDERSCKLADFLVVDARSDQVGRHEIRSELDSFEVSPYRARERLDGQRFGEARNAFHEQVSLRQYGHQHALEEMILADDNFLYLIEDALHERGDLGACCFWGVHESFAAS